MEDTFGHVNEVWLPSDGGKKNRGYGKVTFDDPGSKRTALHVGTLWLMGRNMQVLESKVNSNPVARDHGGQAGRGVLFQQLRTSRKQEEVESLLAKIGQLT